jgi:anti-anti-sigma factor
MTSEHAGNLDTASLDISIRPGPVVTISGEIDIQSGPQLRDQLLRTMRRHGARLALDLTGVTFIDCAGINVLLAARRRAHLEDGWLRVIGASPRVQRVLALTRLHHVLMPTALPDAAASYDSAGLPIGLEGCGAACQSC